MDENEPKSGMSWDTPICIKTPGGMALLVRGPDEALYALSNVWPSTDGPQYKMARRVCIATLCGSRTKEECRKTFLAASREASVFLAELPPIE